METKKRCIVHERINFVGCDDYRQSIERIKIPNGWIVFKYKTGICFVLDEKHEWLKENERKLSEEHNAEIITAFDNAEEVANEVEAYIMKKTTQKSPEWRGGANC